MNILANLTKFFLKTTLKGDFLKTLRNFSQTLGESINDISRDAPRRRATRRGNGVFKEFSKRFLKDFSKDVLKDFKKNVFVNEILREAEEILLKDGS